MFNECWNIRFLQLARLISTWAKDPSTKTGAVIVAEDKSIISVGFNGFPKGMPDTPETYANREEKYSRIIHCEVNALLFANRERVEGASLYTWPFMSCDRCVVQMLQAGIKRFVAPEATEEQLERWGKAFNKTKQYISECNATIIEIPRSLIDNAKIL